MGPLRNQIFRLFGTLIFQDVTMPFPGILSTLSRRHCLGILFPTRSQNMNSDTELTTKGATGLKTLANSMSPRPECNGRRPGPGFGQQSRKYNSNLILLTRAILGICPSHIPYTLSLNMASRYGCHRCIIVGYWLVGGFVFCGNANWLLFGGTMGCNV